MIGWDGGFQQDKKTTMLFSRRMSVDFVRRRSRKTQRAITFISHELYDKTTTKEGEKKVKAWALVQSDGYLPPRWSSEHCVFQPRVYTTKEGAEKVADVVITGGSKLKAIPCLITYSLPKT